MFKFLLIKKISKYKNTNDFIYFFQFASFFCLQFFEKYFCFITQSFHFFYCDSRQKGKEIIIKQCAYVGCRSLIMTVCSTNTVWQNINISISNVGFVSIKEEPRKMTIRHVINTAFLLSKWYFLEPFFAKTFCPTERKWRRCIIAKQFFHRLRIILLQKNWSKEHNPLE